jgi:FkbM family methyltransferase
VSEREFTIPALRRGHSIYVDGEVAYWFEIDHPGEGPRTLTDIYTFYAETMNWRRFIPPYGGTMIDIGGHSGDTAVPMQIMGRGTVLTVEPNPTIRSALEFTCEMNRHLPGRFVVAGEAVTTENCASVEILDHNNAMCNGGMLDPAWSDQLKSQMARIGHNKISVPGLTLASLCDKYLTDDEIRNICFIKLDTEGHDVSILDSGRAIIDAYKPVIFTEWFFAYTEVESKRLFDVVDSLGYNAYDPKTLAPASIVHRIDDLLLLPTSTNIEDYL